MASSSSASSFPNSVAFTELRTDEFYKYRNTTCQLQVIRSNQFDKVYLGFHKFTSYVDPKTSEQKNSHSFVNFPLVAVDELIKCLADVQNFAKQQAGVWIDGMLIFIYYQMRTLLLIHTHR